VGCWVGEVTILYSAFVGRSKTIHCRGECRRGMSQHCQPLNLTSMCQQAQPKEYHANAESDCQPSPSKLLSMVGSVV